MGSGGPRRAPTASCSPPTIRAGENPQAIVDAIRDGIGSAGGDLAVELDRASAIDTAIGSADAADVVLIAGKGHEGFQEIAGRRLAVLGCCGRRCGARPPGGSMMSLAEAAAAMRARVAGADGVEEIRFDGVSTDTRSVGKSQLFVAIRGERYDGHDFLAVAKERGAAAALVDERHAAALPRERHESAPAPLPLPLLVADDTRLALGRLGRHWRLRFAPRGDCDHRIERQDHHQGNARGHPAPPRPASRGRWRRAAT